MNLINISIVSNNSDIENISDLATEIWHEHYTPIIGSAQVLYMLNKYQSKKAIKNQIESGYKYYMVYYKENLCGYFSYKIDENSKELFLSKIYLHKDYRKKGISNEMFKFIEQKAHEENMNSIYLTVNKENTDSIKVYQKKGFSNEKAIVTDIGHNFVMDDYLLRKEL